MKLLQNLDENEAAGLDNLSQKYRTFVLAKPISQICNYL